MTKRTGFLLVVGLGLLAALAIGTWTWPRGGSVAVPGLPGPVGTPGPEPTSGSKVLIRFVVWGEAGNPAGGGIILTRDGLVRTKVGPDGVASITIPRLFLKKVRLLEYVKPGFLAEPVAVGGGAPVPATVEFRTRAVPVVRNIRARIVDPKGGGVSGMRLLLGFLDADGAVGWQQPVESGEAGFLDLPAYDATSTLHLESCDDDWVTSDQPVLIEPAQATQELQPVRIEVRPVTSLLLAVSSASTTVPAGFALVVPEWGSDWSGCDRSEAFRFAGFPRFMSTPDGISVTEIPDGRYRVTVARRGGPLCQQIVVVSSGQGLRRIAVREDAVPTKRSIQVVDEIGSPVRGAVVAPLQIRLNDWMQLMNVHGRFGEETLAVFLDGRTDGEVASKLFNSLGDFGMGVTDEQGKATLLTTVASVEWTLFVPGRGIYTWKATADGHVRLPRPPREPLRISMPILPKGALRGAVAWVENPFPPGGAYPEPVATGFLLPVSPEGTSRVPVLPAGRYRALAMVLAPTGEPVSAGVSVEMVYTTSGIDGPTELTTADK